MNDKEAVVFSAGKRCFPICCKPRWLQRGIGHVLAVAKSVHVLLPALPAHLVLAVPSANTIAFERERTAFQESKTVTKWFEEQGVRRQLLFPIGNSN